MVEPETRRPTGRDGQRQVPERVKRDGTMATRDALQRRLELAHKEVDDPRIFSADVTLPRFRRLFPITLTKKQNYYSNISKGP